MNTHERFRRALNFESVDRLPMTEWATWWHLTVEAWKREGLVIPAVDGLSEWQALQCYWGLDLNLQSWINFRTAETPAPKSHGAPVVTSSADYERVLPTLYPDPKLSLPARQLEIYEKFQSRGDAAVWISFDGAFWGARTLLGIENHLYAFYDEPELMHRINRDIFEYNLRVLDEVCKYVKPDFMTFGEDMSYNGGPMISRELFNEFMLPYYKMIVPELKRRGIKVFVDSDGDITDMVPWFMDAGVEGLLPLERQAGVDINLLQERYPDFLFLGHFDKMTMPRGRDAMQAEFERLKPAMRRGGFIPSVDHQTPPSVSMAAYRDYLELFAMYA